VGDFKIEQNAIGINLMYKEVIEGLSKTNKELPSKYFYDEPYEEVAIKMIQVIKKSALMNPTFNPYWLSAAINLSFQLYEFGIVGDNYELEMKKIRKMFLPNIIPANFFSIRKKFFSPYLSTF